MITLFYIAGLNIGMSSKGRQHITTIRDLARMLNLSPSTISRALKDHPAIGEATKKQVKELAAEYNYEPNPMALSFRNNKTNSIGVIIPEIVHFFFSTVISGIEEVAYKNGYHVLFTQSNEMYEREKNDIKALYESRVDGFLVCSSKTTFAYDHLRSILDKGFPLVLIDRDIPELDCSFVKVDDFKGGFIATEHLIEQGCQKIAFIGGAEILVNLTERRNGYLEALKKHGLPFSPDWIVEADALENHPEEIQKVERLFTEVKPDGIFVHNDMVAIKLLQIAQRLQIQVPQQVKVIGFSNWFFTQYTTPALSTIEQNGYEIGKKAAEILLQEIRHSEAESGFLESKRILLDPQLVPRASTGM